MVLSFILIVFAISAFPIFLFSSKKFHITTVYINSHWPGNVNLRIMMARKSHESTFSIDSPMCGKQPMRTMFQYKDILIARFMGPIWGPSGADRTQVGPMLAPWTLLSGMSYQWRKPYCGDKTVVTSYDLRNGNSWTNPAMRHFYINQPPRSPLQTLFTCDPDMNKYLQPFNSV